MIHIEVRELSSKVNFHSESVNSQSQREEANLINEIREIAHI